MSNRVRIATACSRAAHRSQAPNPQPSTQDPETCNRHPQPVPSTLNPQPRTLKPAPATLNPQPRTLNPEPSIVNPQPATINPQPSTLNPQPSTLNPQPSPLTPQPPGRSWPCWASGGAARGWGCSVGGRLPCCGAAQIAGPSRNTIHISFFVFFWVLGFAY